MSPKTRVGQYLFLFQNILIYNKFLKQKRTLLWLRNPNAKNLKIRYQQKGVKLKCSSDKMLYFINYYFLTTQRLLYPIKFHYSNVFSTSSNNISQQNCFDKFWLNNLNRSNYSFRRTILLQAKSNTVPNYSLLTHK